MMIDCCREFEGAIQHYEAALTMSPKVASTLAAIGFSYHQMGQVQKALEYYHKANHLDNEDVMIEQLVQKALDD